MPIPYSCPHCGKQFSVDDQYAGQTGPCANCGKPITIPVPAASAYGYAPQPAKGGGGSGAVIAILAVGLIAGICVIGVLVALLLPAVQAAREAARRAQSTNNLKQLTLALHNYHDVFGTFPPAVVSDENGRPLYSGRVLLLPFMEQKALYDQFDKDKAWDSPENQAIAQTVIRTFVDPSSANAIPGQTDYLFVTGSKTIFEAGRGTKLFEVTDGTSNTMVLVEVKNSGVNWAEPRDLAIEQPMPLPPGNHPGGNIAAFADGSVRFIRSAAVPPAQIRNAATKDGGEVVNLP
jgi:prepilin-type processing-associated H-X9-DG protein